MTDGRCLCGALRYQIDGPFVDMVHCHCSMCRKHHGAPFATWAVAPLSGFRWVGDTSTLASYKSSEKGHREFCRVCGSVAPLLDEAIGLAIAPAGNLEGDPGIRPTKHMFVASKAAWYTITDALPQYDEYPPEFGMPSTPREPVAVTPGVDAGQLPLRRRGLRDLDGRRCACTSATARVAGREAAPSTAPTSSTRPRAFAGRAARTWCRTTSCPTRSTSARRSASAAARPCRASRSSATSRVGAGRLAGQRARHRARRAHLRRLEGAVDRHQRHDSAVRRDAAASLSSAACSGA